MALDPRSLYLIFVPIAYLLGSIPTGVIVARAFGGVDPRSMGSGNIGATNVRRSAGKAAGVLTLVGDALKGALPVYAATRAEPQVLLVSLTGLAAFLGHLYPVFLAFRGGKGVATACGVMAVVSPLAALAAGAVFVVVVLVKRYVSLGSIIASAVMPAALAFLPRSRDYVPLGVVISALVILKHIENIKRLAAGTERKI